MIATHPKLEPASSSDLQHDPVAYEYHHEGFSFLADNPYKRERSDTVLGVGPSGLLVANLTPRKKIASALDLGTGCGLQALLASRHTANVIATDINPRAIETTRLNLKRNGVTNVQVRNGDLFEPVEGQRFDLIISNPPYVVSPDQTYTYRDGGSQGGGICRRILSEISNFMNEGALAVVGAQWPIYKGEEWYTQPARWTDNHGLDLWLICHGLALPEAYAKSWLEHSPNGHSESKKVLQRWIDWYAHEGVSALATGALILRRRTGSNWRRTIYAPRHPDGPCGDQILRIFEAQDDLDQEPDQEATLDERFYLAPETRFVATGDGKQLAAIVGSNPDIGWNVALDPETYKVIKRLGRGPSDRLAEIRAGLNSGTGSDDAQNLVGMIRQLYGGGFLLRER